MAQGIAEKKIHFRMERCICHVSASPHSLHRSVSLSLSLPKI